MEKGYLGLAANLAEMTPLPKSALTFYDIDGRNSELKCGSYIALISFRPKLDLFIFAQSPENLSIPGVVFCVNRVGTVTRFDDSFRRPAENEVTIVNGAVDFAFAEAVADPPNVALARATTIIEEVRRIGVRRPATLEAHTTVRFPGWDVKNRPQRS